MKRLYFSLAILFNVSFALCQQPDTSINSSPTTEVSTSPKSNADLHPYRLNYWIEGGIIGIGMTSNVLSINRIQGKELITDVEISVLPTVPVNKFDSWALDLDPSKRAQWDQTGDYLLGGIILLPGLLTLNRQIRNDWLPLVTMFAEAHTVVFGIYNFSPLGPTFQERFRPVVYYDSVPLSERQDGNNRNSFYSGHVASAALSTFMMVKVYSDYHPEIGAKKFLLYAAAAIPPLALSYVRVLALKHFPSDNMVGLGLGIICGIAIPELHKHKNNRASLGMFTTPEGGAGLSFRWNPG
ncbi:MAG TPA: phosphatase PAP2 family protein [Chitinophagales bacterium]|nr:phosphatase PAP2 family protein [Chitinophagales bacterium]